MLRRRAASAIRNGSRPVAGTMTTDVEIGEMARHVCQRGVGVHCVSVDRRLR